MRILILHSRYLSGAVSGENRVVDDEAALLRAAGHDVTVWSPEPAVRGALDRVRTAGSAIMSRHAVSRVRRFVTERDTQVVHAHNLFPTLSPAVLTAARDAGAAVVMTLHNYRLMCLPGSLLRDGRVCEDCLGRSPGPGVLHACYRGSRPASAVLATSLSLHRSLGTFDAVTRFLAVSPFVRRKHIEAGLDAGRILVKPNFVNAQTRRKGPGGSFLFLGRLAPEKGLDTVLRAWRDSDVPVPLDVVGDGPQAGELRRMAGPERVRFHGAVAPDRVPELLARARALVVPSRWYEAAPRTIIEAYAAGVPVLASDIGALPDLVDHDVTGRLVGLDDVAAWGDALLSLLEDSESDRLGAGAHGRWRRELSPEIGLAHLERCYADAMGVKDA
jgi:glycosyltransferase involved in cell wall biosynthesis